MKKQLLFCTLSTFLLLQVQAQGQFKVKNDGTVMIGYNAYGTLTFGQEFLTPNNGKWAIEHWDGGLNFWKPWPTWDYGNYFFFLRDDGNIGIGDMGDQFYKLKIDGYTLAYDYYTYSDLRLKQNVEMLGNSSDKIALLRPCQFQYKPVKSDVTGDSITVNKTKTFSRPFSDSTTHFGLIAQDVEKIFPNLVREDSKGMLSVNYMELVPILISAVQEQNEKIKKLEEIINSLKQ
jgi:hypothetical protein